MSGPIFEADGSVAASAQHRPAEFEKMHNMPNMIGIILRVYPADDRLNFTAKQSSDQRGIRHECTVLATDRLGRQPDVPIHHVVIPPQRHSGVDNFEEDLPRGCSKLVDGTSFNDSLAYVDYAKLDGEWAIINFIGGNFDLPYIAGWWHHPSNPFDLTTSASGYKGKALGQYDNKKDRSRYIRRVNGTCFLVNKYGSVYLDTTESNSQTTVKEGKLTRSLVDKGGHVQLDVEKGAQLEINFNEKEHKGPRLGAGSTKASPVTDEDLLHPDQPIAGSPQARPTVRSYRRQKQWETLEKTSSYNLFCENTEASTGKKGEALLKAEDTVSIVVNKGSDKGTMINIAKGKIQVWSDDGTQVNVLNDEVQIVTKSGGMIDVKGKAVTVSGKVDISGPLAVGGLGEPVVLGNKMMQLLTTYFTAENTAIGPAGMGKYFTALASAFNTISIALPPFAPIAASFTDLAAACNKLAAADTAAIGQLPTTLALNTTTT